MQEKEFNLLDEPWIRVIQPDCSVKEVSLTDLLDWPAGRQGQAVAGKAGRYGL
ncbi:MAG: hypothetical protein SPG37_05230 [Eubacteriales bacterium]|nr:hypothetical protein [Eubacteriales bacterium]